MDKMMILSALLALALVVTAFQSFQLASIKSDLGRVSAAPAALAPATVPVVNVPAASAQTGGLNNLPNMVGGC